MSDLDFAEQFLKNRIVGHQKDVAICLRGYRTPREHKLTHAYFPALIITLGFGELLAGLHAGQMKGHGRAALQTYFDVFMDRGRYPRKAVDVLYEGLRHKIAHLGHPYIVYCTSSSPKVFGATDERYIWTVCSSERTPPINLVKYTTPRLVTKHRPPWPTSYDHRIKVSVSSLSKDLVRSVFKPNGYFSQLESGPSALSRFMHCMEDFYPREAAVIGYR